jgi:hypothetical protein
MAIKFNSITFDLKDLILIIGLVSAYFNFKSDQSEKFTELKKEIAQIISDNKIQEVKVNARFDAMLNKPTSEKSTPEKTVNLMAVIHDNKIEIIKKRLVKFKLAC